MHTYAGRWELMNVEMKIYIYIQARTRLYIPVIGQLNLVEYDLKISHGRHASIMCSAITVSCRVFNHVYDMSVQNIKCSDSLVVALKLSAT